jgi:O-antigen/teichoic acid export membrane protein
MSLEPLSRNKFQRGAIEFGWMVGGRALALVASLLYIRLTAQILDKAEYGLLAVIVGIANGLHVLLGSPLAVPLIRIINENADNASGLYRLVGRYLVMVIGVSALLSILIAMTSARFWPEAKLSAGALISIAVFVSLYALYIVINAVFTAWRARGIVTGAQCSLALLRLLLTLPLIWFALPDAGSVFVASALAFLPLIAVQLWLLVRRQPGVLDLNSSFPAGLVDRFWSLVRQNAPQVWINASIFFIDKPLFALVLPLEQVAVYTIMQQIARALSSVFIEMGVQFMTPYAFLGATRGSRLHLFGPAALIASCGVIAVAVYFTGTQLATLVASQKYAGLDPFMLAAMTFGVCLSFAVNALELKGFTEFNIGRYIVGHALQAITFLGGGLVSAAHYGIIGVVTFLLLGALARALAVVLLNRGSRKPAGGGGPNIPDVV